MVTLCGNGAGIRSLSQVHVKNIFEILMPKLGEKVFSNRDPGTRIFFKISSDNGAEQ
jgi:hypothetical protein